MGQTLPNIGIYVPSSGETNYGTSFAVGQAFLDSHDHSGAPHGGVPISGSGIANGSITGIKLNDNAAGIGMSHNAGTHALDVGVDALSTQINGSNQLATIKASGAEAVTGTDANKAITPSTLSSRLAAPGPIGATTPSTGVFTTLSTNGGVTTFAYSEGVFTPNVSFGGSSVGVTNSGARGSYRCIGKFVHCNFAITLTSKGAQTGTAAITGLPLTVGGNSDDMMTLRMDNVTLSATYTYILSQPIAGTTAANLLQEGSGAVQALLNDTNFANNSVLQGTIIYQL